MRLDIVCTEQQCHCALMILFLRQHEQTTLEPTFKKAAACVRCVRILDCVVYIQSHQSSLTKLSLKIKDKINSAFSALTRGYRHFHGWHLTGSYSLNSGLKLNVCCVKSEK